MVSVYITSYASVYDTLVVCIMMDRYTGYNKMNAARGGFVTKKSYRASKTIY